MPEATPVGDGRTRLYNLRVTATSTSKGSKVLTIKGAAALLGVSEMTLRRWDESGKFRARRHPINGYRLYDRGRVEALSRRITGSRKGIARGARGA